MVLLFLLLMFLVVSPVGAQESLPQDRTSAVILVYHGIGDDPAIEITAERFAAHVEELTTDYNVMGLPAIVDALRTGHSLPEHTVGITFDGAYRSVLQIALPLLEKNNLPFTIFIATDMTDSGDPQYAGWDELKALSGYPLATLGLHPSSFERLQDSSSDEIRRQINKSRARLRDMLGIETKLFAYPFGEYSLSYRDIVKESGFDAAFGQQSAVAFSGADLFVLPRFSMTENYGEPERLRTLLHALPLPVSDIDPANPVLAPFDKTFSFTVDPALMEDLKKLSCFASGSGRLDYELIGNNRIQMTLPPHEPNIESLRVNCTLPVVSEERDQPRWRWFGTLLTFSR